MMPVRPWAPPPLNPYRPLIINVALTGAVPTKADNPSVPITPEEIAADAIDCAKAGASIVHIHVRDDQQKPIQSAELYQRVIVSIRESIPDLVICVTTSSRVDPDLDARLLGVRLQGDAKPDMASLTLGSFNFPTTVSNNPPDRIRALLQGMQEEGVKPELEIFEPGMANTAHMLIEEGLIESPPYVNILLGSRGSAPAEVGTLAHIVERLPQDAEWAAAGIGVFQRHMTMAGILMGGNVRTGLEDSIKTPDGELSSNFAAVEYGAKVATLLDREIATPSVTRRRLGLGTRG